MTRLLSLFLLFAASVSQAADPKIENLHAMASNGRVSVGFGLANAFQSDEVVEGLQSGLPTSFTYDIEIFRDRPWWLDDGISRSRIEVICTFNSVTREYLLNYRRDKKLVRSESFTDLVTLQSRMTNIEERDLFDIGNRRPQKLKVAVKADLKRGLVFYVVPWAVSTGWRETRVKIAESATP